MEDKAKSLKYEYFMSILTDEEKSLITQFVSNPKMFAVVKNVLMEEIMSQGIVPEFKENKRPRNFVFGLDPTGTMSDEDYGKAIRTHIEAIFMVEKTFNVLLELGEEEKPKDKEEQNQAR